MALGESCVACHSAQAQATSRNRRLCSECFQRFARSKVMKRMETYRFKNNTDGRRRKLLLALSGGISSQTLLHILDGHLQKQLATQHRTAYDLIVAYVETSTDVGGTALQWFTATREKYSHHTFLPMLPLFSVCEVDEQFEDDMRQLGFPRQPNEPTSEFVGRLLHSARTATAGNDILETLKQRLIYACARRHDCEGILWGHSDSRLAAKALAAVAKGRGASLHADVMDGPMWTDMTSINPLRDLFQEELELYMSFQPSDVRSLAVQSTPKSSISIRSTSIDELLTTYIATQGEKYPNIMANVVRTIGKLEPSTSSGDDSLCRLCKSSLPYDVQVSNPNVSLCHSCTRTTTEMAPSPP